ncbi:DNA-binding protein [Fibrisoma montanum]|uniref:DNA-binding protein n=1 Tax=Fibrisoma montanum TaxID=2305895 RepID=A0A418MI82_9BACT|nr:helix-turn-helix domain-containing protein [Fibrisoma montanum]RIV27041.1 DNA-binding protein [Fibrisoma montanum]
MNFVLTEEQFGQIIAMREEIGALREEMRRQSQENLELRVNLQQFTVDKVAALLDVSERTVHNWTKPDKKGRIKLVGWKLDGVLRFSGASIMELTRQYKIDLSTKKVEEFLDGMPRKGKYARVQSVNGTNLIQA